MSTPNLIMPKPFALIQPQSSLLDSVGTFEGVQTGMIMLIYQTSDKYQGGESVLYNPQERTSVVYSGQQYFIVDEKYIIGTEQTPP